MNRKFTLAGFCLLLPIVSMAQEKKVPLQALQMANFKVRPQAVTRTTIQPQNGSQLLLYTPAAVDVSLLDPANQRIQASNASLRGFVFESNRFDTPPTGVALAAGNYTIIQFPASITAGSWRLEVGSTSAE